MTHKLITLTAALMLVATLASAQPPGGGPGPGDLRGPGHGRHGLMDPDRIARILDLTAEQSEQLQVLAEERRAQVEPLRQEMRALREELETLRHGSDPEATALGQLVLAMTDVENRIRASFEELDSQFSARLTPEQLERWQELKERWRAFRDRRGPRGHHGPWGAGLPE